MTTPFSRMVIACTAAMTLLFLCGCDSRTRTERQMDEASDAVGAPRMNDETRAQVRYLDREGEAMEKGLKAIEKIGGPE